MISSCYKDGDQVIYTEIFVSIHLLCDAFPCQREYGISLEHSTWNVFRTGPHIYSSPKISFTILHYMYVINEENVIESVMQFQFLCSIQHWIALFHLLQANFKQIVSFTYLRLRSGVISESTIQFVPNFNWFDILIF